MAVMPIDAMQEMQSIEAYMNLDVSQQLNGQQQHQQQQRTQPQYNASSVSRSEGTLDPQQLQNTNKAQPATSTQAGPVPFLGRQKLNRACNVCHERKIKCNAFQDGVPCDNCKGRYECFLPTSRRGRRPKPTTQDSSSSIKTISNTEGLTKENGISRRSTSLSSTSPNSAVQTNSPRSDEIFTNDQDSPSGSAGKRAFDDDTYQGSIRPEGELSVKFWGPSHSPGSALEAVMEDAVDESTTQSDIIRDGEGGVVPRRKKRRTSSMISVGLEEKEILGALGFKSGNRVMYSGDTHSLSYLIGQFTGKEAQHARVATPPHEPQQQHLQAKLDAIPAHEEVMPSPEVVITEATEVLANAETELFTYRLADYPQLSRDDWDYLKAKQCFTFPPRWATDQLVHYFFKHCLFMLPIINRSDFLRSYLQLAKDDGSPSEPPSPLVLQAILHNASTYASLDTIKACGFDTRLEAYTAFFMRTKYLYYLEFERSQVTVTQALCLIGGRHERMGEERGARYWLACGLRLCENQGWHRLTADTDIPIEEKRMWKRIFWTTFTRDASVAIALGNPLGINIEEISTEELTLEDFIEEELPGVDMANWGGVEEGDSSIGHGLTKVNRLYSIHVVRCARIAHQIVACHFVGMANPTAEKVIACIKSLNAWRLALPEEIQYVPDSGADWTYANFAPLLLEFAFHLVRNLHMRGLNAWKSSLQGKEGQKELNKVKVFVHTTDMSRLVEELLRFDLIKYTPQACLTPIFAEMTPIISEMWATDLSSARYKLAAYKLELLLIATEGFEDMFSSAKWILELFRRVIKRRIDLGEKAPFVTAPPPRTDNKAFDMRPPHVKRTQSGRLTPVNMKIPNGLLPSSISPTLNSNNNNNNNNNTSNNNIQPAMDMDQDTSLMFMDSSSHGNMTDISNHAFHTQSLDDATMDFRLDFEHDSLWPENFGMNFDSLNSVETYLGEFLIKSGLSSDSSLLDPIDINSPWR